MKNEEHLEVSVGQLALENWGRIVGLELVLRTLVAERALKASDPLESLATFRNQLLEGMARQGRDDDPVEAFLIQYAEAQINDLFDNVRTRLSDL